MRALRLALLLALLAPAAHAAEWPQFHQNAQHTGTVASDFAAPTQLWWSRSTGGRIDGGPAVSDGRVFVGSSDGKLYAFDGISGDALWTFDAGSGSAISTTPAVSGGIVYAATDDGRLVAVDAATGHKRLDANPQPGARPSAPSVFGGRLYVGTARGSVLAYDLATLTKDWEYRLSDETIATNAHTDPTTGQVTSATCERRFADQVAVLSSPSVYKNRVYAGSDAHAVFALNEFGQGGLDAGKTDSYWQDPDRQRCPAQFPVDELPPAARIPELGGVVRAAPAVDDVNNLVIVASYDNTVRAFDADTGEQRWNYTVSANGQDARVAATPAVSQGKVYFGAFNGLLYALETVCCWDVHALWSFPTGGAVWSSAALSNGLLAVGGDDATVRVLDAGNGQQRFQAHVGGDVRSAPAIWTGGVEGTPVHGGVLFVGAGDGTLYAYGGTKPALPDLAVTDLGIPGGNFYIGSDVKVNATVANVGAAASPPAQLRLLVDHNLAATLDVPALDAGASATVTYTWRVPGGNHTLEADVDPSGAVRQFDRSNDRRTFDTAVAANPPQASSNPPPGTSNTPPTQAEQQPRAAVPLPGAALAVLALAGGLLIRRR